VKDKPAFPHRDHWDDTGPVSHTSEWGLNIREYFAIRALQGILANPDMKCRYQSEGIDVKRIEEVESSYASISVRMADALIKELSK